MITEHSKNADKYLLIGILIVLFIGIFVSQTRAKRADKAQAPAPQKTTETLPAIPNNYTLQTYTLAETLPQSCTKHQECETPAQYLVRSNCPYTSLCINAKCSVVCPDQK